MNSYPSFTQQVFVVVLLLAGIGHANAQVGSTTRGVPSSSPYQQTLSPYLNLLRSDSSALSPYNSFVRPRQQIRQQLQSQSTQLQRFEREARSNRVRSTPTRLPTGRGGSFNNYLHYYQSTPRITRR